MITLGKHRLYKRLHYVLGRSVWYALFNDTHWDAVIVCLDIFTVFFFIFLFLFFFFFLLPFFSLNWVFLKIRFTNKMLLSIALTCLHTVKDVKTSPKSSIQVSNPCQSNGLIFTPSDLKPSYSSRIITKSTKKGKRLVQATWLDNLHTVNVRIRFIIYAPGWIRAKVSSYDKHELFAYWPTFLEFIWNQLI